MKFGALAYLFCGALVAASPVPHPFNVAAALASSPATDQLLQDLLGSSSPLPSNSRRVLAERIRNAQQQQPTQQLSKRQALTSSQVTALLAAIVNYVSNYFAVRPTSKVPDVQEGPSPVWPGARRKKIRSGPYRIPAISEKNVESYLLNVQGLMNTIDFPAVRPCKDDCVLLGLTADLEYDDGRVADVASGAWLHHTVLLNFNEKMKDPVCGTKWDVLFEAGNEKTNITFAVHNSAMKTGYHLKPSDQFLMNAELMNLENKVKWTWLTLTYDYVEGTQLEYKDARVVWLSIGAHRCAGAIEKNPFGETNLTKSEQPTQLAFTEYSMPWIAPQDGYILGGNGHVHEGGTGIDIFKNDQLVCTSTPHYSKSPLLSGVGGMSHNKRQSIPLSSSSVENTAIEHIDRQDGCELSKEISIKKGDSMYIKVSYDFTLHAGMKNKKGELDEVMGVVGSLVAFEPSLR